MGSVISKIKRRNAEKPIPDGLVKVEFDAGGDATFVTPNPVRPVLKGDTIELRWMMEKAPLHANSGFDVYFGNIVPCVQQELVGFKSIRDPDGKGWTWSWIWTGDESDTKDDYFIFYDVFFIYQPKGVAPLPGPRPHHQQSQTVSLRQILSTDPTIILPPKAGGG